MNTGHEAVECVRCGDVLVAADLSADGLCAYCWDES